MVLATTSTAVHGLMAPGSRPLLFGRIAWHIGNEGQQHQQAKDCIARLTMERGAHATLIGDHRQPSIVGKRSDEGLQDELSFLRSGLRLRALKFQAATILAYPSERS